MMFSRLRREATRSKSAAHASAWTFGTTIATSAAACSPRKCPPPAGWNSPWNVSPDVRSYTCPICSAVRRPAWTPQRTSHLPRTLSPPVAPPVPGMESGRNQRRCQSRIQSLALVSAHISQTRPIRLGNHRLPAGRRHRRGTDLRPHLAIASAREGAPHCHRRTRHRYARRAGAHHRVAVTPSRPGVSALRPLHLLSAR